MSNDSVLDDLRSERDRARDAALELVSSTDYDPDSDALKGLEQRSANLDQQIERLSNLIAARDAADALDGKLAKAHKRADQTQHPDSPAQTRQSWGETFIRSDVFTEYRGRGQSAQFRIDDDVQTRALPTGIADLVAAGFKGTPASVDTTPNTAPTPLLDSISKVQVSNNAIEFVAWTKKAGAAAKVAEKAAKASAEWGPTVTSTTLDTYAVYTQLTRQLIEDFSAVRSIIDTELRREVDRAVEADAAAVLAAATAAIPDAVAAGDLLAAIRKGIGTVQGAGYSPTAVLLNPADWAAMDVAIFSNTLGGPTIGQSFWGLRPITSTAQAAGTAVVGDFTSGITHFFRAQVALYITDSHDVTFLANVFTLLAEKRGKTAVVRPLALCEAKTA
jgi:hypothetical protein